jgi:hypothetical protein
MSYESHASGTLYVRDHADYRPATPQELIAAARVAISRRFRRGSSLESPGAVRDYLRLSLRNWSMKCFA